MPSVSPRRRRLLAAACVAATIALGLASRRFSGLFPAALGKYPGDALWAAMVYFGLAVLRPRDGAARLALLASSFCLLVELLKRYQAPWIVDVRHTVLGHLVFGHVFSIANLVAYGVGIGIAAAIDRIGPGTARRAG